MFLKLRLNIVSTHSLQTYKQIIALFMQPHHSIYIEFKFKYVYTVLKIIPYYECFTVNPTKESVYNSLYLFKITVYNSIIIKIFDLI